MDWITLLKAQQTDLIQRLKKPKTYDISLLECPGKGCHSEIMAFWGDRLQKIMESVKQQTAIVAQNLPPTPSEYRDDPEWGMPFADYFRGQVSEYLLREEIVTQVMSDRFGKLLKKIPVDSVTNMILDDEGNLRGESKFYYLLTAKENIRIQVHVTDGESFNSIKKDKVKWSVSAADLKNHQIFIFLCLFFPFSAERGYEKKALLMGFLPTNQLEYTHPKLELTPSQLLYSGGFRPYLESIVSQKTAPPADNVTPVETPSPSTKTAGWECTRTLKGHSTGINCLTFSPDRQTLASGSRGETKVWDFTTGKLCFTLSEYPWMVDGQVGEIYALAFSPDGRTLASGGEDSKIKIWHAGAREVIDILKKHDAVVRCITFTNDGQQLISGGDDRKILFWNLQKRKLTISLPLDDSAAHSLALSANGHILASGSYRKIKVWQLSDTTQRKSPVETQITTLHTLTGHTHIVSSLAISHDGKLLLSGSRDRTIKIWQIETGQLIHTLNGHTEAINAIALSPDGQTIASASTDQTVKIWHTETGELLSTFTGHTKPVTSIAFTPDGQTLASASTDKTIKIWQK